MSLDYLVKNLYDMVYPVGICIDFDDEKTDPNVAFPGTTWVRITDNRYQISGGVGSVGEVGGASNFLVNLQNLPNHTHSMAHTHSINHNHPNFISDTQGAHQHTVSGTTGGGGDHTHTRGTMDITGEFGNNGLASRNESWSGQGTGAFARGKTGIYSNREVDWSGCTYTFTASKSWTGATSASGTHTHSFSATANLTGSHSHTIAVPNYTGNSGASSAANTGGAGSNTPIEFYPSFHKYARWKRTA